MTQDQFLEFCGMIFLGFLGSLLFGFYAWIVWLVCQLPWG